MILCDVRTQRGEYFEIGGDIHKLVGYSSFRKYVIGIKLMAKKNWKKIIVAFTHHSSARPSFHPSGCPSIHPSLDRPSIHPYHPPSLHPSVPASLPRTVPPTVAPSLPPFPLPPSTHPPISQPARPCLAPSTHAPAHISTCLPNAQSMGKRTVLIKKDMCIS